MPSENKAAAGDRSPGRHDKASHKKESRSRSRADQHRRSKSKSRDRRGRGSNEEADGKRHRVSRRHSKSRSPSRSHSRGKSAFLGSRQYSPPRKRPRQSRSRSASPATLLGPHGVRLSMSPGEFGPAHHLHPGRGPPPYDARWQPRGFEGPMHREPPPYGSYGPGAPPYGGQPLARRWAAGPPSRFGGRIEQRSPPPHWAGRVNPTTGSPIRGPSPDGPRDRPLAAAPQRGTSQWGTAIGWERIGNETNPADAGQGIRHSPISPVHSRPERDGVTPPRPRLNSTAPPHSPMSPPREITGHAVGQAASSAAEGGQRLQPRAEWTPHVQAGPMSNELTNQELAGNGNPDRHTKHHSDAGPTLEQRSGARDVLSGQSMVREARSVAQSMTGVFAQKVPEAGRIGRLDERKPGSDSKPQEMGTWSEQKASPEDPPSVHQGAVQHHAASAEAAASRLATAQAAQQAAQKLRELVMGADYSEKDWYYVDPQGATQGPCCIAEFREWMHDLQVDPQLSSALKQFSEVAAWKDGAAFSVKMRTLMATVNQLSPSPPSSPNPRDTKLAGSGALV